MASIRWREQRLDGLPDDVRDFGVERAHDVGTSTRSSVSWTAPGIKAGPRRRLVDGLVQRLSARVLSLAEGLAGAAMTNQFLLEESPWLPLALLVVAAVIAWARRSSNSILVDMLRR